MELAVAGAEAYGEEPVALSGLCTRGAVAGSAQRGVRTLQLEAQGRLQHDTASVLVGQPLPYDLEPGNVGRKI
ncbi:hypothetical protein [Streptomyces iconiensis]|uniref:Uncharacterized protein n=1 Tax=Streptomyces iconiensis TaxID=1384038 RepID=A0ABT7A270_9ACTN|nr:hypothetical protein [Streptomyces iconiensis]MDJ1135420.1 hypothetical protein [Streptomyces iconiensis]